MLESIVVHSNLVYFNFRRKTDPAQAQDIIWQALNEFYYYYFSNPDIENRPSKFNFSLSDKKPNSDEQLTYAMTAEFAGEEERLWRGVIAFYDITKNKDSYRIEVSARNRSKECRQMNFAKDYNEIYAQVTAFGEFGKEWLKTINQEIP